MTRLSPAPSRPPCPPRARSARPRPCGPVAELGLAWEDLRVKGLKDVFFSKGDRPALFFPTDPAADLGPDDLYPGRFKVTAPLRPTPRGPSRRWSSSAVARRGLSGASPSYRVPGAEGDPLAARSSAVIIRHRPIPLLNPGAPAVVEILIREAEIHARVAEMGKQIEADYQGRPLTIVAIPDRQPHPAGRPDPSVEIPLRVALCRRGNRGRPTASTLVINEGFAPDVAGRDVLLLDDILDTGHTLGIARPAGCPDHWRSSVRTA